MLSMIGGRTLGVRKLLKASNSKACRNKDAGKIQGSPPKRVKAALVVLEPTVLSFTTRLLQKF